MESQLDAGDLATLREALAVLDATQQTYQHARQALREAEGRMTKAAGAVEFLRDHYATRYGLEDGDAIQQDGTIQRARANGTAQAEHSESSELTRMSERWAACGAGP